MRAVWSKTGKITLVQTSTSLSTPTHPATHKTDGELAGFCFVIYFNNVYLYILTLYTLYRIKGYEDLTGLVPPFKIPEVLLESKM